MVAIQTGLRASELTGLRCEDVQLGTGAHVRCHGKGRKERCTPLRKDAAAALRAWLRERGGEPRDPVFPNQRGGALSHDSLEYRAGSVHVVATEWARPWPRCSVLYQGKNDRQKAMAAWISSNRLGKPGWYFRVLNWASEKGLSSLTGRGAPHGLGVPP